MGGQLYKDAPKNPSLDGNGNSDVNELSRHDFSDTENLDTQSKDSSPIVDETTTQSESGSDALTTQSSPIVDGVATQSESDTDILTTQSLPNAGAMTIPDSIATASLIWLPILPLLFLLALIKYIFWKKRIKHRSIAVTKRNLVTAIDKLHRNKKELTALKSSLNKTIGGQIFQPYTLQLQDINIDWSMTKTTEKIYLLRDSVVLFHKVEQIHQKFQSIKEVYENSTFKSLSKDSSAPAQSKLKSFVSSIQTQIDTADVIILQASDMLKTTSILEKKDPLFRFASRITPWNSKDECEL